MKETMVEARVTYTLLHEGKLYVIEHVPARVCVETGEQFFAPETVEHVQILIKIAPHPLASLRRRFMSMREGAQSGTQLGCTKKRRTAGLGR